jgi:hypothetical protein
LSSDLWPILYTANQKIRFDWRLWITVTFTFYVAHNSFWWPISFRKPIKFNLSSECLLCFTDTKQIVSFLTNVTVGPQYEISRKSVQFFRRWQCARCIQMHFTYLLQINRSTSEQNITGFAQ